MGELEGLTRALKERDGEIAILKGGQTALAELQSRFKELEKKLEQKEGHLTRSEKIIQKLMAEVEELKPRGSV